MSERDVNRPDACVDDCPELIKKIGDLIKLGEEKDDMVKDFLEEGSASKSHNDRDGLMIEALLDKLESLASENLELSNQSFDLKNKLNSVANRATTMALELDFMKDRCNALESLFPNGLPSYIGPMPKVFAIKNTGISISHQHIVRRVYEIQVHRAGLENKIETHDSILTRLLEAAHVCGFNFVYDNDEIVPIGKMADFINGIKASLEEDCKKVHGRDQK